MTTPSPAQIAQTQRERKRAALQAALAVLPCEDDSVVVVPAAGDMDDDIFRKHCKARFHGLQFPFRWEHQLIHRTRPDDFDHIHKGEDNE